MTYSNENYNQYDSETKEGVADSSNYRPFDFAKIVSVNIKFWWVTVLFAVLLAGAGFGVAKATYEESYTSTVTFIASNTSSDEGPTKVEDTTVYSKDYMGSSDVTASKELTNTFVQVLTSNKILNGCIDNLHIANMFNAASLRRHVTVNAIEETQKLELKVTTSDAKTSCDIAREIMDNYDDVLQSVLPNTSLNVLDEPYEALEPNSNSNLLAFTSFGFLLGAFLSILIISLKENFNDTFVDIEDIKRYLGLRILGIVPSGKNGAKKNRKDIKDFTNRLITSSSCEFSYRETFKAIRTKLIGLSEENNYKTFVVTSTIANEGKTTVSVNMALALSQAGKSVLLIDGDIRQPSIDKILGIKNDPDFGLTNVIQGKAKLEESIYYIDNYNICVILSGAEVSNPSELLASEKLKSILETTQKEFDYVIIDSPPANLVTDSSVLGQYVDASILVVRQKHARVVDVRYIAEDMKNNGANLIGCVFNGVDRSSISHNRYYGYYGYGDRKSKSYKGYGYGYGYGNSGKKQKNAEL